MISIDLKGAEQFIAKSRKARGLLTRTVVRSLRKSLRKPATERRRMTRSVPMVRAILRTPWGKRKDERLTARVKVLSPRSEGNTVNAGIGMYGYPAAARIGEGVRPHVIPTRSGGSFKHPGTRVMTQIGGSRGFPEVGEILRQLERDVHEMLGRVYGL